MVQVYPNKFTWNRPFKMMTEVNKALEQAPAILRDLLYSIPKAKLDEKRLNRPWTIKDEVNHLIEVQPILLGRLKLFKKEMKPVIQPYMPNQKTLKFVNVSDADQVYQTFAEIRDEQMDVIKSFTPLEWEKEAEHGEYEEYGTQILVRHIHLHDCFHMYKIEELWLSRQTYL